MGKPGATDLTQGRTDFLGPTALLFFRFAGMCYGWSVLMHMFKEIGYFPLASYTMISWTLTTLRYTFGRSWASIVQILIKLVVVRCHIQGVPQLVNVRCI